ncbi:hypothetical protein ASPZODRAFT_129800 [Penicilliopsis zonata CBS 506.65]|uniref:Zinc finger PHD-type domain-containing protein n=1 Tax=Penicilliopsis zonata CBS 506.65 TaxID=1073090 RepID=A0A1L9SQ40_9EURO|nr:hypothetical protein ASPZODRAFT_129800 [Penicilliopsis zonata CBS 506.65]OJJ49355.1 hypothetical protein ASPZODRAFT_129800 [Penicilliopsis zonata CBS 506.65]
MVSRKRTRSELDAVSAPHAKREEESEDGDKEPGLLERLRNCWEFANLMQYITLFGRIMKIDEDFEIDDLEDECMKPGHSEKLLEIGLCLLKWVSSHRGLNSDNFDEYTRRQYNAKAPHLENPFGHDETPKRFCDFDIFLKLRVLHQLSVWTFWNADRIREKMPEQREWDQTQWRIEELGYDRHGRYYYVLDDNRLYRRTEPPIPPPKPSKPKKNSRSARAARASKRRRLTGGVAAADDEGEDAGADADGKEQSPGDSYEIQWECIAITRPEYQDFVDSIQKTKDADEKILRDRLVKQVMPVIEKADEAQERKRVKREKELLNLQLLAGAKRSSRIAQKTEKERHDREAAEAARKHDLDLAVARKEQDALQHMERERQSRIMTRERRIKDREQKRLLHEAELAKIAEEQEKLDRGESRVSQRQLKAELEKQKKSLEELSQEDQWTFDCSGCGVHGENLDDGSHSVACEKCSVWQHSKCLGIAQSEAERDDFHFICADCKRREEEAKLPKIPPLKFRVGASSSPPSKTIPSDGPMSPLKKKSEPTMTTGGSPRPTNLVSQPFHLPPVSPERRPHSQHVLTSPRAPFSPLKSANGLHSHHQSPKPLFSNTQPPLPPLPQNGSFYSQRPSSSHSVHSPRIMSPIQNTPSMSPTQGNHDVGPLAGFPPQAASANGASRPWTPYGQQQQQQPHHHDPHYHNHQNPHPEATGLPPVSSIHSSYNYTSSFSATATPSGGLHHPRSSPPQSSHGLPSSGISPVKNSPRPVTAGGLIGAPVLPPIQRLEPSPKLMGRSSPDAPIPPPVKCMTPEQEERRQRENALMFQNQPMSSPSLNRLPPLGPSALSQSHEGRNRPE